MKATRKIIVLLLAAVVVAGGAMAQKKKKEEEKDPMKYKKLEDLYGQEKFADCLFKAEKYQTDDKYMKDPEPYLYASMSYFGAYKDPDRFPTKKYPEFMNPLKDALSSFSKFRKRDKTGEALAENKAYSDELKGAVIEESMALKEKKDITHLSTYAREMPKAFDKDEVMMMLASGYLLFTNNAGDGLRTADSAMAILKKKAPEKPVYNDNEKKALSMGFVLYTDYLLNRKDNAKAKDAVLFALDLLPSDEAMSKQAEKMTGDTKK